MNTLVRVVDVAELRGSIGVYTFFKKGMFCFFSSESLSLLLFMLASDNPRDFFEFKSKSTRFYTTFLIFYKACDVCKGISRIFNAGDTVKRRGDD